MKTLVCMGILLLSSVAHAKIEVVTTLPSFAYLASIVGGDEVSAVSLTRGTQDPHFVDAKPDLMLKLNRARLVIHAGLGLEDGWLPPLLVGARNGAIQTGGEGNLNASSLAELKDVPQGKLDRAEGDVHPGGNPHYMLDPRNGVRVARGIAERLGRLEPSKAADFKRRAEEYAQSLEKKITAWKASLSAFRGAPVVTYHRSFVYFLDWLGAEIVGTVEPKPGIPPSPEHTVRLISLMKERKVAWILMEPFYPAGVAEEIARETKARRVVVPTEVGAEATTSYEGIFDMIAGKLK